MNPLVHDPDSRLWLLSTPSSGYALRLAADDSPRHVAWGPRLTLEQALSVSVPAGGDSSFDGVIDEEYPAEGPARFGPPSLQVRFDGGARGVQWHYLSQEVDGGRLSLRFRDDHYPLEITLHYRVHDDSDVIERWATLHNTSADHPIEVLRCDAAAWTAPPRDGYRLSHITGGWSAESQLERVPLARAETVLTSRRGHTSHQANPWVMLDAGDATEEHGEVWSAALAWSGSWRIAVHHDPDGRASWTGGAGHEGINWTLRPGQRHRTPVFAGLYTSGGFGAASRQWHSYQARHVLPQAEELRPVTYNSWEATGFDVDEDNQRRLATAAADLGVELFVMDDGWFGGRRDARSGLGDWTPNPTRFPHGLGPLATEVRRLGMRFGIWVEPEMVNPDSDLYRAHPDWVLHMPHRTRTTMRHQLVLNFARDDVADWAYKWLDELVGQHDIEMLKWDMNRAFTEPGWPQRGADGERLWIDHITNVYAIIDRLRAAHAGLRIETCAGGGGRVDLGILARTDQAWISDNTDAVDRIAIQHGYSQLYPARTMAAWVTDSPNPHTGRVVPLAFRFHVAMSGVLGLGGDLLHWTAPDLAEARTLIAAYKDIRPVVQHGELYRLGQDAVQYLYGDRVVVLTWRLTSRPPHQPLALRLAGLEPGALYRDETTGHVHHGHTLMTHGIIQPLPPGDYASALIRLRRA
ncbi:alpha-galactosidase [Longispora fulva]|uniref:Alpha-galactosidase n=1 Tax=Longispora fulva TaxID=619741 RepID=A0A8J7KMZ4_9ACTN|nr:alpha-galactosidase [Longispora fulva]MBG6134607.1 alpha-galactosidase [Longispora fulva]GIG61814.1 alpha-galactosidase [Longispora fulva]